MDTKVNIVEVFGTIKAKVGFAEVFLLVVAVYGLYRYFTRDPRLASLPPHVRGWPIINQTLDQMQDDVIPLVQGWAKQYGEIFRTTSGTTTFIWLNSRKAVKELIDRRSVIYSSRHPQPMVEAAGGGKRMVFMPYGKSWRAIRNVIHRLLTPQMSKSYSPIQTYEAKRLSMDLLDRPQDFYMHNRRYSASVIMTLVYGRPIPSWDCEEVKQIYGILERFATFRRPGAFLVDVVPELADSWLFNLFSPWKKIAREIFEKDSAVYEAFWKRMKREVADGTAPYSWGKEFVQSDYAKHGVDEMGAIYTAGSMIEAGSETTSQIINNTLVGLLSNPEVMRRCQEELDRVIGPDRTPTMNDMDDLNYTRSLVKETLRWRPINKLGSNHYLIEDDWYEGYFLPKNSIIMINQWALHYNEDYKDPWKYDPERYVHDHLSAGDSAAQPDVSKRDHFSFGGGRRICPGLHVAERSIFLNLARLLWGFDLTLAKDENGEIIPIDFSTDGLVPGALSNVKPFKCSITVRSPKHERILRQEWATADKVGVDWSQIQWDKV